MMNKKLINDLLKLKQVNKDIYVCVVKLRTFVPEDDNDDESPLRRPYGVFVFEGEIEMIRGMYLSIENPTPDDLLEYVLQGMVKPMPSPARLKPMRTKRVFVETPELQAALQPKFAELSMECLPIQSRKAFDEVTAALSAQMSQMMDVPETASLSKVPGVTVPMMAEYFDAAAAYYQATPWAGLWNNDVIEIRYPEDAKPYYGVVLGNGGEQFGLALYASLSELQLAMNGQGPSDEKDMLNFNLFSMMYGEVSAMGFDDLDAIDKYNWPVVNDEAYPGVIRLIIKKGLSAPTAKEIAVLSAALRTLPTFVRDEMQATGDTPKAANKSYELPNVYGRDKIMLKYPLTGEVIEEGLRSETWDMLNLGDAFDDDDDEENEENEDNEDNEDTLIPIADESALIALTAQIQKHLPITFTPSKELRLMLKEQDIPVPKTGALTITECMYQDVYAGISVAVSIGKEGVLTLPLVFIDLDKKHPLYSTIQQYQDDCMVAAGGDAEND